jgi:hypothetical protein
MRLQGLDISVFSVQDRTESLMKKLQFWESCIESNHQTECFCNLHKFLIEEQLQLDQNTKTNIIAHLRGLSATFKEYFPVLSDRKKLDSKSIWWVHHLLIAGIEYWRYRETDRNLVITNKNWDSKDCHWSTFGWAWKKSTLCWQEKPLQPCYHFQLPVFAKNHFLLSQIWKPSTETDSMQNKIQDFICLRWYRTTKHYADQNKRILHIEIFVQGSYMLWQISSRTCT